MATPRYPDIVADLRRRIERGELPPGAKVPSTRRIAAEWGVAMATAAKALTTLAQEGLVRAEPRSGTVVAERRPAPAGPRAPHRVRPAELTRERVVRAAIAIADAEGLGVLSMRGVAARLGVAPMSPYRHVSGKDELVVLMTDTAFGERGYPARPPDGWRARWELGARTLWSLYRRHPWLAHLSPITRPLPLPNLAVHADWALSALEDLDLSAAARCDLHVTLFSYVHGVAVHLERERQAMGASGLSEEEWMDGQAPAMAAIVDSGRYPAFARMLGALAVEGYDLDLDHLFELGLRAMLDGLELRFDRRA
ncbi:TetR/AcrR family transcriptional regulator C-terminal domain-containing protein [Actinosynnema sp. NPDC053489]|uniref:TetR/AcrR family transcriptional regulator C-terminal domain-containing protein n=1 Tax=Actinosynnema sp. NPDC053489 TaxID=3363916 RepID=UPI0037C71539